MREPHILSMSIRFILISILLDMYNAGKGRSKHADKQSDEGMKAYIYCHTTLRVYISAAKDFYRTMLALRYKINGHTPRTLTEAFTFIPIYLEDLKTRVSTRTGKPLSACTIVNRMSGVCKAFGYSISNYAVPVRHREDYTRGRIDGSNNPQYYDLNNYDIVTLCLCTGLRKNKELLQLRGSDLVLRADGRWGVNVKGKGGKMRIAGIYGTRDQVDYIVSMLRAAGDDLLFTRVPQGVCVHYLRACYAVRVYLHYAVPDPHSLPRAKRYDCRAEWCGVSFDRDALLRASRELGHNRVEVIANHYMYPLVQGQYDWDDAAGRMRRVNSDWTLWELDEKVK